MSSKKDMKNKIDEYTLKKYNIIIKFDINDNSIRKIY